MRYLASLIILLVLLLGLALPGAAQQPGSTPTLWPLPTYTATAGPSPTPPQTETPDPGVPTPVNLAPLLTAQAAARVPVAWLPLIAAP